MNREIENFGVLDVCSEDNAKDNRNFVNGAMQMRVGLRDYDGANVSDDENDKDFLDGQQLTETYC